jgi:hypothetical protein
MSRNPMSSTLKRGASAGVFSSPHSQPKPWLTLYEVDRETSSAAPRHVTKSAAAKIDAPILPSGIASPSPISVSVPPVMSIGPR